MQSGARSLWGGVVSALVFGLIVSGSAAALSPATLTEPTLEVRSVRVIALEAGVLRFVDRERNLRQTPTSSLVRLSFDRPVSEPEHASPRWLRLTDGQVLFGDVAGAADGGEGLRWRHPGLGEFVVSLDHVTALGQAEAPALPAGGHRGDDDVVTLLNGDTLRGYVVAVEGDGLVLDSGDGVEVSLPWSNLRSVVLSNPAKNPSGTADLVRLTDGSIVRSEPVTFDEDSMELAPLLSASSTPMRRLPLGEVTGIDFGASQLRLLELASLPMRVDDVGDAFGLSYEPYIVDGVIRLHAPVQVTFELPAEARRISARVDLDLPPRTPPAAKRLAAVTLWVRDGERPVSITQVNAGAPTHELNLPLSADRLGLQLDEATHGPVLDRVVLSNARVLVAVPAEPLSGVDTE